MDSLKLETARFGDWSAVVESEVEQLLMQTMANVMVAQLRNEIEAQALDSVVH